MNKITSTKNPRIQELVLLHQTKNRFLKKQFLIEGEHLISMALATNFLIEVYIDEEHQEKYQDLINKCIEIKIYVVNKIIIKKLSQNKTPQPIIGVCKILNLEPSLTSQNIILIDRIQDPGNLGTILRSATAFNITDIFLSEASVDVYNHKVISASQGAIFYTNVHYENFNDLIKKLILEKYYIYGTFLAEKNSTILPNIKFKPKNAFLFGNEGQGISEKFLPFINENIIIPTTDNVESLNLATSITIVIYCLFIRDILK